jgi:hypothetical protein
VHLPRQTGSARTALPAQAGLSDEWWSSWRRANALGWDYLNAVSGLFRMNVVDAFNSATRFMTPFRPQ